MIFNSLSFLLFFAIVLAAYYTLRSWTTRKALLLVASYLFYAAWNPPFVVLLWISTVVDWFTARRISAAASRSARRRWLFLSLGTNLGMLGYFKYGNFLLENFVAAAGAVGIEYAPPAMDIVLPVGISFYTFQTLSYTIDVYRGDGEAWDSPLDFALFVTFFPQLVAGPIVRAFDFLPQTRAPRAPSARRLGWGLTLLVLGLFQKSVIADTFLAPVADAVYWPGREPGFTDAWLGTFAFAGQIFCDFAGYSTCAIGAAMCLGFTLPDNFRFPYAAIGFSDFWRRWHISLSQWLRDYLYISLGGNRKGTVRTYVNLSLTMLLGGLWHGAAWSFVVWGALHGLYLVLERIVRNLASPLPFLRGRAGLAGAWIATYLLVCIAWVFFRAPDLGTALDITQAMLSLDIDRPTLSTLDVVKTVVLTVAILAVHLFLRNRSVEWLFGRAPGWARSLAIAAMLASLFLLSGDDRAFIYFQF